MNIFSNFEEFHKLNLFVPWDFFEDFRVPISRVTCQEGPDVTFWGQLYPQETPLSIKFLRDIKIAKLFFKKQDFQAKI